MCENHVAHPRIANGFEPHAFPRVLLVERIGRIERGFAAEVFDTGVFDAARPYERGDRRPAKTFFQ
ncbi:hypothetical protein CMV30_05045 [Nibricoccus aquaticus]|uniref:Uncharacterized protein n=1 Tax=Nibricoccus aquaticus TaxID=2576891 RepID=A0A290Q878_9BACT|nr:hypothetical protein CMV30_05045 [Nibricoccus aquaticus]